MPLMSRLHTCYNGRYRGLRYREWSESLKAGLSSDRGLQLDPVKLESLVIADQQRCGEDLLYSESIHRSVADLRLLATPTSRGRVADPDPN